MPPELHQSLTAAWLELLGVVGWALVGLAVGSVAVILGCALLASISTWSRRSEGEPVDVRLARGVGGGAAVQQREEPITCSISSSARATRGAWRGRRGYGAVAHITRSRPDHSRTQSP